MKTLALILLISFGLLERSSVLAQPIEESKELSTNDVATILKDVPCFNGVEFCSRSLVRAVNRLQSLGKNGALKALRLYMGEHGNQPLSDESQKVLIICRFLFVNPEGWKPVALGEAYPSTDQQVVDRIPRFPLILFHGTPFLLISGYSSTGYLDDTGSRCLKLCESFDLVTNALSESDYEDAARSLINSEDFKSLYSDKKIIKYTAKMIFDQAMCSHPGTRENEEGKSSLDLKMWSVPQTNGK